MTTPPFAGAVLAGGRASRMGGDKALLEVDGRPLIAFPLAALEGAGAASIAIVGGDPRPLAGVGYPVVGDLHRGAGPLGGILTALAAAEHDVVVVLACDQPAVTPSLVRTLVDALDTGATAAVPLVAGVLQPMTAAFRRDALPDLRRRFDAGERAVHRALDALCVERVTGLDPVLFIDLDSPDDLRRYASNTDP
jgi:molybdopterin-guanine dinucleotide biosynthesis protein A